jgi:RNA 2',3'-cyclic 3'-phosphodiesterase
MRLFVGVAPPPAVLDNLDAACAPLRPLRDDLRWTNRPAWHITLAFLGEVTDLSLTRLLPRLERAAWRHRAVSLSLAGAGAFPKLARANVLWTGVTGDLRGLSELAASVAAGARRAGAVPPDAGRRFQPHLTLARCRAPVDVSSIVASLQEYRGPEWTAEEIYLIRSVLGGGQAGAPRYETVGTWKLRPPV